MYPLAVPRWFPGGSRRGGGISRILARRLLSILPVAGSQLIWTATGRRSATWRSFAGLCQITRRRRLAAREGDRSAGSGRTPAGWTYFIDSCVSTRKTEISSTPPRIVEIAQSVTCSSCVCDRCWKRRPLPGRRRDPGSHHHCSPLQDCWEHRLPSRIHPQRQPCLHWNMANRRRSIRYPQTFLPLRSSRLLITSVAFPALCIRRVILHNNFYPQVLKSLL